MPSATLFAVAWSLCALIDLGATTYLWLGADPIALALAVSVLAAAIALLRRRTPTRLTALATLWAAHILFHFPLVPNHNVALAAANLTIAVASFRRPDLESAYVRFAGAVRLHLIALYLLAGLHKLNWAYLDAQVSCASALARGIAAKLFLPYPPAADRLAILGSLGLELGIPLLLAIPRTRLVAVAVGLAFHLVLSLDSIVPVLGFSAAVYALYVPFLPEPVAAAILRRRPPLAPIVAAAVALAILVGSETGHAFLLPPPAPALPAAVAVGGAILVRAAWHVVAGLAIVAFTTSARPARATRRPVAAALLVFPLLVVLDGLAPYLGVKTVPCFSMFSNLVTAEGASNHVFLPARRGAEDDLVEIVDSSSLRLRAVAAARARVPAFELRRLLSGEDRAASSFLIGGTDEVARPDFWLVYRRAGRTLRVERGDGDALFRPHPWLVRKLTAYRLLSPTNACVW